MSYLHAPDDLPRLPHLEPDQFWFILRASGQEQQLLTWVANLNDPGAEEEPNPGYDPMEWAQVSAKLQFAKFFERDHPMVEGARQALGLSPEELDALWQYGAG
ncbi:MAG: hypothetical protein P0Y65_05890 [Candidatus Devosia phytovorans]|uniref:Uncharacterized protein n=1 Tax=Candidatus Devosia phytovorans TaxID=3121372 RepID=A0AAJ5VWN3_9HYPH|nr:hypothetical protein [Devosia sp.]WEK05787.1 MAG: hypothetical protein P0Y65_05890 [Devosia sp.]